MLKIQKLLGCFGARCRDGDGRICANLSDQADLPVHTVSQAGGPTDTLGRNLAQVMGKSLKQQLIVENVVGAGGDHRGRGAQRRRRPTATRCCCTTSGCRPRPRCTGRSLSIRSRISSTSAKWPTYR